MNTEHKDKKDQDKDPKNNRSAKNESTNNGKHAETKKGHVNDQPKDVKVKESEEAIEIAVLKEENTKLLEQVLNLNGKIFALEEESKRQISDFQAKAREFERRAQEELTKHKSLLATKYEADLVDNKKYGAQKMLEQAVEPLINIEIAITASLKSDNKEIAAYVSGFAMLVRQLTDALNEFGVIKIEPAVGTEFDPLFHHAIGKTKTCPTGKVCELKGVGYRLHERVLKAATVVIGE